MEIMKGKRDFQAFKRNVCSKVQAHREYPVEDAVLLDGEEAVDGPGEVVLVLEVAQRVRDDLGCVGAAGHVDETPLTSKAEKKKVFFMLDIQVPLIS